MNRELPDVQAGFRKGRGTRDQMANICWIIEKAREFQKKHLFLLTEAEDIQKRWQEYTEELYKKDLHEQIITMV